MKKELADEFWERQLGGDHIYRGKRGLVAVKPFVAHRCDRLANRAQPGREPDRGSQEGPGVHHQRRPAWRSALPIYTQENGGRQVSGYTN